MAKSGWASELAEGKDEMIRYVRNQWNKEELLDSAFNQMSEEYSKILNAEEDVKEIKDYLRPIWQETGKQVYHLSNDDPVDYKEIFQTIRIFFTHESQYIADKYGHEYQQRFEAAQFEQRLEALALWTSLAGISLDEVTRW